MSRVDVIIPCYKYGHYLRGCVTSVLSQGVDVRVLIIDDCSPDDSAVVGAQLAAEDSRVTFRKHDVNRGHIATYNEGLLGWASGDYCVLLSADDFLLPGALKRAVEIMDANPAVSFVYGSVLRWSGEGVMPAPKPVNPVEPFRVEKGEDWITRVCHMCYNHVISPEVMVRTKVQQEIGGYNPALAHTGDLEMWMRLASRGDVGVVTGDQAMYRVHAANMHKSFSATKFDEIKHYWAAFNEHFTRWNRSGNKAKLVKYVATTLSAQALEAGNKSFYAQDVAYAEALRGLAIEILPESRTQWNCRTLGWKLRLGPRVWRTVWWMAFPLWLPGAIKRARVRAESRKRKQRAEMVSVA